MNQKLNLQNAGSVAAQNKKDCGGCLATLIATEKLARSAVDGGLVTSTAVDTTTRSLKFNARKLKIATFNVRTLADTNFESSTRPTVKNKTEQLIRGCQQMNIGIDILCIQEHRLKTKPGEELNNIKSGNWTLIHSDSTHQSHGVAVLLSDRAFNIISSVTMVSTRIMAIHLKGIPKMCVISAYAPTEVALPSVKDKFYNELKDLLLSIPPHTVVVTAGDFNARLG